MKEFLTENWKWLSPTILGIFEFIFMLVFKKRPQIIDNGFLSQLSNWILEAEVKYVKGSDKLQYVLDKAKVYLGCNFVETDVKKCIEYVLTLPQKKGVDLK